MIAAFPRTMARAFLAACSVGLIAFAPAAFAQEAPRHLALNGIQSGLTAPSGVGFVVLAYTDRRSPTNSTNDGSAVLGLGFGDADTGFGAQVSADITSLSDKLGDSGYLSLRFSKRLVEGPNPVYGSLQFGQLVNWGDASNRDVNASLAITRFSQVSLGNSDRPFPLIMTLGIGSAVRNFETDPGVFGGIGIGLTDSIATSIAWTGDSLTVGADFKFKGFENVLFGISVDDATNRKNNRRVIVSVGYKFDNLFGGAL